MVSKNIFLGYIENQPAVFDYVARLLMDELKQFSLLVVVPAYNEAENLPETIADLREFVPWAKILVVDDGSVDDTEHTAARLGCQVLKMPFNVGIGGAVQAGYQYALAGNYDFAAQFDGDGQHRAQSLPGLLSAAIDNQADLVIGSRYLEENGYQTPFARRLGMRIFSRLVSFVVGQKISDSTSGFRVLSRRAITFCANVYPSDYPEVEVLPLLHFAGMKIMEAPAKMKQRFNGKSSITWTKAIYYMLKVILAIIITILREIPIRKREVA